ncbi:Zn(II)2Cys6 transcription factor [Aspergillus mulundensis]|uniref:Putative Zn(II)2Cys6 transcription factor n=1 Tax=Aspergillus mulundensis TaxID=1810919 RepID=A0A3D8QRF2_9EURO|nr:putative Zn(II)2Cys6 transcription factor [Aspergillus mulundensis]RDW64372.1 putative Zn(II)2Cys6 transcription factor [Aspergillus mulundensis]
MSLRFVAPIHPREPSTTSAPLPKRTKRSAACMACKARRTRCVGNHPCDRCIEIGSECVFAGLDRRRKYAQRRAEQELDTVQKLVDEIIESFDGRNFEQLGRILERAKEQRSGNDGHRRSGQTDSDGVEADDTRTNRDASSSCRRPSSRSSSSSVGSLDEVDTLTEDPNRTLESRAAGYIGKESEIAWMQKLDFEANKLDGGQEGTTEEPVAALSYHVDNLSITETSPVDARLLPPRPWAAHLVNIFFDSVAPSFPLLNKALFVSQFNTAFSGSCEPTPKWLAVLNLVFAISAKYYQLAEPIAGRDVDDRIFLSRALSLRTSNQLLHEHADLHQVQIDLLLGIYYLASGQVNRSWRMNGNAARAAVCLGLNLRTLSEHIDPVSKETRTRIWWSIFSLEHLLSGMTGRAPCLDHRAMSLYPPVPYDESSFDDPELQDLLGMADRREERLYWTVYATDEELASRTAWLETIQPSPSLYFFHLIDLSITTHAAVMAIYSLQTAREAQGGRGQSEIPFYQSRLQSWLSNLRPPFAFADPENNELNISRDSRVQVTLALSFYSSQIILSRPCLTRPGMKEGTNIRFPRSRFGNDTARTCVHSAISLITILPDEPDMTWMLKTTPWWTILHFVMQAITVLLIQLSVGPVSDIDEGAKSEATSEQDKEGTDKKSTGKAPNHAPEAVQNASQKALRWLQAMGRQDPSSRRAFEISSGFLRRIAKAKHLDLEVDFDVQGGQGLRAYAHMSDFEHQLAEKRRSSPLSSLQAGAGDAVNWGPDRTVSEGDFEWHQQHPFVLDPALFSVGM